MANTCKKMLPIPNYGEKIVDAIGMQDHVALVVSLIGAQLAPPNVTAYGFIHGLFAGKTVQRR